MDGETVDGKIRLRVPNLVMNGLFIDRIREMLLPESADRDNGVDAGEKLFSKGDIHPLREFIEQSNLNMYP